MVPENAVYISLTHRASFLLHTPAITQRLEMHPPPKRKSRLTHAWSHELSKTCKGHSKSAKAVQLVDSVLDVGQRLKLSYTIVVFIDKDKLSICLQLYP